MPNNAILTEPGPLLNEISSARDTNSLSVGTFTDFAGGGIPLMAPVGSTPVLVLFGDSDASPLKIVAKTTGGRFGKRFDSIEHRAIGDNAQLTFADGSTARAGDRQMFLSNGLSLTYGQIVALGGDFYGIPDKPISSGGSEGDREQRFRNCFETLASDPKSVNEVGHILQAMKLETDAVDQAVADGKEPSTAYEKLGHKLDAIWNVITGGGSAVLQRLFNTGPLDPSEFDQFDSAGVQYANMVPTGRYLKLAATNYDHFGQDAIKAYTAGHSLAIRTASDAGKLTDPNDRSKGLDLAYAYNAFADHFLTDLFSSGHLRTPRRALYESSWTTGFFANFCAETMHGEDSKFGLLVTNKNNYTWRAWGDANFFAPKNHNNAIQVEAAVQDSVNDVHQAFLGNDVTNSANWASLKRVGTPQKSSSTDNFAALFIEWDGSVQCRNDLNDLNCFSWTKYWTTTNTARLLKTSSYSPNKPGGFLEPPPAGLKVVSLASDPKNVRVRYMVSYGSERFNSDPSPPTPYLDTSIGARTQFTDIPRPTDPTVKWIDIYRQVSGNFVETSFYFPVNANPYGVETAEEPYMVSRTFIELPPPTVVASQ